MIGPAAAVRVQRTFRATADEVFAAWLTPSSIERWMFGRAGQDEEVVRLEVDARVGGRFSFLVRHGGHEFDHVGEYLELDRPRRLVFTWDVGKPRPDGSRVELELTGPDGEVLLTLVHTLPADAAPYANRTRAGWMRMLAALAQLVEGGGDGVATA
ncbi:MAG TPA: SRPBCC family protein [Kofleriaceae bacterium]|nr:SRPBCC family protein [Kofleriaceae bacterium]